MKSEWRTVNLSGIADIQTGPFGSQLHKADYVDIGTPIVTVEHLGNKHFTTQNLPQISDEDKERLNKYILSTGDIVFSRVGSVDRCSYVEAEHNGWMFSGRCLRVRPKEIDAVNAEYLYYYFTKESTKQYVRNIAVGATMPSINTSLLGEVPIVLPPLPEQRAIATTLSCLDNKIELNNKINANLEAQAQAIFDNWFDSPISDKWPTGTLYEIADLTPKRSLKKSAVATYIEMSNLPTNGSFPLDWEKKAYGGGVKFQNGDTLLARITPCLENGKIAYVNCLEDGEVAFGSTEYIVLSAKKGYPSEMLYFLARYSDFVNYAVKNMSGTSGRQRVSADSLAGYKMKIPPVDFASDFTDMFADIMNTIRYNSFQNRILAAIRDTLLPKLMNGEIEVSMIRGGLKEWKSC